MGSPGGASGKEPMYQGRRQETWVQSLGQEDPLEEGIATHSSILAWRILWAEEPGRLQSIGSRRVGRLKQLNMNACIYNIFPGGSDGKEYICNARDLGSIPGLGRPSGGGDSSPL